MNPINSADTDRKLELLEGKDVFDFLENKNFQSGWDALYQACPWATIFQSREFVTTWYQTYRSMYVPLVVKSEESGQLCGLLTLAIHKQNLIFGAGEDQAEYQVWMTRVADGANFIKQALKIIYNRHPGCKIQLQYIPANTPMSWLHQDPFIKKHCRATPCKQPFVTLSEEHLQQELKKKNRREKMNRLKRLGELTFEHIADKQTFTFILDELVLQYDFRRVAMYNRSFFLNDPERIKFIHRLFDQGLLQAMVLKLNKEVIASYVVLTGKNQAYLQGLNTHAPAYAKYSPGVLHFFLSGMQLAKEGIKYFDLTPGGDLYKDALATNFGVAYQFCFSSPKEHFIQNLKDTILHSTKKAASRAGLKPTELKNKALLFSEKIKAAKEQGIKNAGKQLIDSIRTSKQQKNFIATPDALNHSNHLLEVHKNSLQDLLLFKASGSLLTRWEFMKDAMKRFEGDQTVYTWCREGQLLACVWTCDCAMQNSEAEASAPFQKKATLLQGFYHHPDGNTRLKHFLASVAAAEAGKANLLYAQTTGDEMLCNALKATGFKETATIG